MKTEEFKEWWEAFDTCREKNHPIIARVKDEICKIYPSGSSKAIRLQRGE